MSSSWPITRLRTKNNHLQCWFVPKSNKPARRSPLTPLTSAEAALLSRVGGRRGWEAGRARRGRGGVCKRPCARRFSLRAPSLARCPNPFSPCTGLVQHGSFLLAAASSAADVEHLDWLDEYGTMTIVYDGAPVGIIGEPTDGPLSPPGSPCALVLRACEIHFAFWIIETATPCYDIFGAQRVNAIISSRPLDCLPRYLRLYSGGGAPSKGWLQVIDLSLNLRPCYKT